jgi:PAS domain-containing protein
LSWCRISHRNTWTTSRLASRCNGGRSGGGASGSILGCGARLGVGILSLLGPGIFPRGMGLCASRSPRFRWRLEGRRRLERGRRRLEGRRRARRASLTASPKRFGWCCSKLIILPARSRLAREIGDTSRHGAGPGHPTQDPRNEGFSQTQARSVFKGRQATSPPWPTQIGELQREALLAASSEGMIVLAADGVVTSANHRSRSMLGLADGDIGQSVRNVLARVPLVGSDGVPLPVECWPGLRALRGETVRNLDVGIHREGRTTWLSTSAVPIVLAGGACGGAVVTLSDVTMLRTLELHHEQLIRLVSHDIRNPLTSVHLNAQLLQKSSGGAGPGKGATPCRDRDRGGAASGCDDRGIGRLVAGSLGPAQA